MRPESRRVRGWIRRFLVSALVAGGCAALPRIEVPPATPNTTVEQFLTLRWALVRDGGTVRAVGRAESSSAGGRWDATVALEGVDGRGLVVSRGVTIIRPGFGPGPTAFEAELAPKGGETEYRLHVVQLHEYTRPGR
jgi:hypothetical protein